MCEVCLQRQRHHLTSIREVFPPAGILKAGGSEYSEGIDPEIVQIYDQLPKPCFLGSGYGFGD